MTDLPTVLDASGPQPQAPAVLNAQLLAYVAASNPGYTATLPGSLIEDISSTDTGALVQIDAARVETVNSLTPFGCNAFTLNQLGGIYGVPQGAGSNGSASLLFTGTVGFVITKGFTVSDGTNQYIIQDGGIVASGGTSPPLFALATASGVFPIPANTVSQLVTSVPSTITLSVTNPDVGIPGGTAQTESDYRAQVLQAGLAASQGMPTYLKTLLQNVSGVQTRLVSVRSPATGVWEIIVGGGDPYEVSFAIYEALFDISTLVGSTISVTAITNANLGIVTTDLNYGLITGSSVTITGVTGMSGVNGTHILTAITDTTFSFGVDTTSSGAYVSGGVITPNNRNTTQTVYDYPDKYNITYVLPPSQAVAIDLTWNTTATNLISDSSIQQLGQPAIANYINGIPVGQAINLFEMQTMFQEAIAAIIPPQLLSRMVWTVSINGVGVSLESGTGLYVGDPESYFNCAVTAVTIARG